MSDPSDIYGNELDPWDARVAAESRAHRESCRTCRTGGVCWTLARITDRIPQRVP